MHTHVLPGLPSFYLKIWLSEVERRCIHWLKIKMQARWRSTSRIGKRNQSASIWCVDHNFDCGCDCYTILHLDSLVKIPWTLEYSMYPMYNSDALSWQKETPLDIDDGTQWLSTSRQRWKVSSPHATVANDLFWSVEVFYLPYLKPTAQHLMKELYCSIAIVKCIS